ncbi:Imm1 family immunity protein [Gandjariella thermophila]|uniref:Immunity protein Imm1 n=1 Tax=Gandjariella thermophila TaxID=1931992 RepID=A0A4D4JFI9_9PSEU|nr:Imm1 family immunity protein [Gandjariella thermophila]GDY33770.1 hypothetical protein GTS_54030 [Gandjariella thermophila]
MTITARWADLRPGTVTAQAEHEMTLSTSEDIRGLVERLSAAHTSEAHLVHHDRPRKVSAFGGDSRPDHHVVVGVWQGFGYIEYTDPEHWSQPIGDPNSPEWHTSTGEHFRAGSGIPITDLVNALSEFLTNPQRPACLTWREHGDFPGQHRVAG